MICDCDLIRLRKKRWRSSRWNIHMITTISIVAYIVTCDASNRKCTHDNKKQLSLVSFGFFWINLAQQYVPLRNMHKNKTMAQFYGSLNHLWNYFFFLISIQTFCRGDQISRSFSIKPIHSSRISNWFRKFKLTHLLILKNSISKLKITECNTFFID